MAHHLSTDFTFFAKNGHCTTSCGWARNRPSSSATFSFTRTRSCGPFGVSCNLVKPCVSNNKKQPSKYRLNLQVLSSTAPALGAPAGAAGDVLPSPPPPPPPPGCRRCCGEGSEVERGPSCANRSIKLSAVASQLRPLPSASLSRRPPADDGGEGGAGATRRRKRRRSASVVASTAPSDSNPASMASSSCSVSSSERDFTCFLQACTSRSFLICNRP
mmetsp:Transcript_126462/g.319396  ORF Transcript_126462/g.319396 Transcript_126462/m.319396 type:complete len:217 (+) Transcript_126462:1645-2295(+)